jgi:hypothetical protein
MSIIHIMSALLNIEMCQHWTENQERTAFYPCAVLFFNLPFRNENSQEAINEIWAVSLVYYCFCNGLSSLVKEP